MTDADADVVPINPLLAPDVDELLAEETKPYHWIVPGLWEAGDRTMITANEGVGKSTLQRHIAMTCASGLHPFTLEPIDPLRVFLMDCENPKPHVKRELAKVRKIAGDRYHAGHLRVRLAPGGVDLTDPEHAEHLLRIVEANEADLLVTGPLYKLGIGDPSDEPVAKAISAAFDRIRAERNTAILIEAHTPHAQNGVRPKRPYGASLWLRWPEFGVHLAADGRLSHFRVPRDERDWPAQLRRDGEWPWTAAPTERLSDGEQSWRPTHLMERVSRMLEARTAADDLPSRDALAKAVQGKHQHLTKAIDVLLVEGYAERAGQKIRSLKAFREGTT